MKNSQSIFYMADPDVSTRLAGDDGAVLFHPDTAREKFINATGAFVWKRLYGSRSRKDIVGEILDSFEGVSREQADNDLAAFLKEMMSEGFAETHVSRQPGINSDEKNNFADVLDAPQSFDLSLTGKCNLHCAYCFYHDEMQSRKDLPASEWFSFFDELKQLGVRDATLSAYASS
jgi:hypothetical protein